ncbi:hypothetical protein C8J57DRAFT_1727235 [Mycena rebaudengoi]|nr:hypothetical protein C8J57DRAFT_1727235 [Mycena rebaudengoi]
MDEYYDLQGAVARLAKLSSRRRTATENRNNASDRHLATVDIDTITIHQTGVKRKEWRLCGHFEEGKEPDELIVRVQGILVNSELVPSAKEITRHSALTRLYISQRVSIAGYGDSGFDDGMAKKDEIFSLFERYFPEGTMQQANDINPLRDVLTAATRVFTPRTDAPTGRDIAFTPQLDPIGRLEHMKGNDLIHISDNQVMYTKRIRDPRDGGIAYVPASPGHFRSGDIVEAEIFFVAIQRRDKSTVLTSRPRGIILLDSNFSKGAELKRRDARKLLPKAITLKRTIHYSYKEELSTDEEDDATERNVSETDQDAVGDAEVDAVQYGEDNLMVYVPSSTT